LENVFEKEYIKSKGESKEGIENGISFY